VGDFVGEPFDKGDEGGVVINEALEAPELGSAIGDGLIHPRHGLLGLLGREDGAQRRRRPLPRRSHPAAPGNSVQWRHRTAQHLRRPGQSSRPTSVPNSRAERVRESRLPPLIREGESSDREGGEPREGTEQAAAAGSTRGAVVEWGVQSREPHFSGPCHQAGWAIGKKKMNN
jgi:hypothetical protein